MSFFYCWHHLIHLCQGYRKAKTTAAATAEATATTTATATATATTTSAA